MFLFCSSILSSFCGASAEGDGGHHDGGGGGAALLAHAMLDSRNSHFVLLDTSIPVFVFDQSLPDTSWRAA